MTHIKNLLNTLFKGGFFHILLGGSLTKIIAFLSSILIIRFINKSDYAFLAYTDNLYSYILLLSGLGCGTAILKYCVTENYNKNYSYFRFAIKFGTLIQALIILLFLIGINLFNIPFEKSKIYIYMLALYPMFYFWIGALQSYMRSLFRNKEFAYAGLIQTTTVLILSIGLVLPFGVKGVIIARYLSSIIVVIYCVIIVKKFNKSQDQVYELSYYEKKSFLFLGISLLIANLFSMVMPLNEGFLVNNLIKNVDVTAEYKVAALIPSQLPFFTTAIVTYYLTIFATYTDKKQIWEKLKKVGYITIFLIGIISILGIVLSPYIISIAYGDQYKNTYLLMTLMWVVHAINAGMRMLPMNILPIIGYARFNMIVAIISSIVHFAIDYILINKYGINGAVIASGLVYLCSGFIYWIYIRRKLCGDN